MSKTFRPYEPDQLLLMPPALSDWVPENHLARFVSEGVDGLDLSAIEDGYDEEWGYPPYHPRMGEGALVRVRDGNVLVATNRVDRKDVTC